MKIALITIGKETYCVLTTGIEETQECMQRLGYQWMDYNMDIYHPSVFAYIPPKH